MNNILYFDSLSNTLGVSNEPANEFKVFGFGNNRAWNSSCGDSEFSFDKKDADTLISMFSDCGVHLSIDYDHKSLKGGNGKAAGWIKSLDIREDGLYATNIEWTPKALKMLKDKEYRYFSPSIELDDEGNMVRLLPAALTNFPALKGIKALMNSAITQNDKKDKPMATTTDENVVTFSAADMKAREDKVKELEAQILDMDIEKALEKAISDKKLAPAKRLEFAAIGKKAGLDTLNVLLSALTVQLPSPVIEKESEVAAPAQASYELTKLQKDICAKRGYTKEQYHGMLLKASKTFSAAKASMSTEKFGLSENDSGGEKVTVDVNKAKENAKKITYFEGIK